MQSHNNRAYVMGHPVGHSLSPALHRHWIAAAGIAASYDARDVAPAHLQAALRGLVDNGDAGCNLTIPHKEAAVALMDDLDISAIRAGAVNTVVVRNGKLHGYNSDGFGFVEQMKSCWPDYRLDRVVIAGTGGAARGIVAAVLDQGATDIVLTNRTRIRAEKLAADIAPAAEVVDWDDRHDALSGATLVVNCAAPDAPPLRLDRLPRNAAVADIVYRPLMTPLLHDAAARGHAVIDGLGMLLHQGRAGFRAWFGIDPVITQDIYNDMKKRAA